MKTKISGSIMQTVTFELAKGEKIFSEAGGMSWMSSNILMETSARGGIVESIKRKFSGDTFFMNSFSCSEGTGIVTFANEFPGKIIELSLDTKSSGKNKKGNELSGKEYICQKDSFMCAEEGVELSMHLRKKIGTGFFGGEGFILQKISGKGKAFVELTGEIVEIELKKDQILKVGTGHIGMFEPTVEFDITLVSGVRNIFVGGEGLFLSTLKGPGKVWLQSMPLSGLAGKIGKYLQYGGHQGGSRGGVSGLLDKIGGA